MSDPSLALQGAEVAALKADIALQGLVGGRIYDQPPAPAALVFPYVVVGEHEVLDDSSECIDGTEVYSTVHIWSRTVGFPETKRIAAEVRRVLGNRTTPLAVGGYDTLESIHEQTLYLRDPDGITRHGVSRFKYLLNAAA